MEDVMRIVVLTGSGVSAESGVATFRDRNGVWAKYDWRRAATPEGFAADPAFVHAFYNERRRALPAVRPNAAHYALAKLEKELAARGGSLTLVTQNVDDLHERAGSKNLIHMHGELMKARCGACYSVHPWKDELSIETRCPVCDHAGAMRPHVVWFGEIPMALDAIYEAVTSADLFAAIGTSGAVYPAAGLVGEARAMNIPCTELNLEPSENAWLFTDSRYGPATKIVPRWVEETLNGA
ncbi:NAD-dependent deacylase [Amphiplicatus metriothermophilus]